MNTPLPTRKLTLTSLLCFGALSGLAGAALYVDPSLLENWIGPTMVAAPVVMWLVFYVASRSALSAPAAPAPPAPQGTGPKEPAPDHEAVQAPPSAVSCDQEREGAIAWLLSLFQQEGRLLDFLQEDLEAYDDAQIGAAAREVHRGCRVVLQDALGLAPVLDAPEGTEIEVESDFDVHRIRLIGEVHGQPPFRGVLRHKGWRFTRLDLPATMDRDSAQILAPAEVEIG